MNAGFLVAINAVPFLELLDEQEESLAAQVLELGNGPAVGAAMDASRRRLAQGVSAFVGSLPSVVRNDANTSRAAAYALVGLADERMLHHPAGGLDRWRERLLEFELYESALAGQEIVTRARATACGTVAQAAIGDAALLAPLYLGVFRAGFEGALRDSPLELSLLVTSLEETVGTAPDRPVESFAGVRPMRIGLSPLALALAGIFLWLGSGLGAWLVLSQGPLQEAGRIEARVSAGLSVGSGASGALTRSIGPSDLDPVGSWDPSPLETSSPLDDPHLHLPSSPPPSGSAPARASSFEDRPLLHHGPGDRGR